MLEQLSESIFHLFREISTKRKLSRQEIQIEVKNGYDGGGDQANEGVNELWGDVRAIAL